ncbi:hypothetical protein ACP3V3_01900 [Vibrio sp. PNB22_3_1]
MSNTSITLTLLSEHYRTYQSLFDQSAECPDDTTEHGDNTISAHYYDMKHADLDVTNLLENNKIPYDMEWDAYHEVPRGSIHFRIDRNGQPQSKSFTEDEANSLNINELLKAAKDGQIESFINNNISEKHIIDWRTQQDILLNQCQNSDQPPTFKLNNIGHALYELDNQKQTTIYTEHQNESAIGVRLDGFSDNVSHDDFGHPVLIEQLNGELRVVIWSDINQEDPTHIISLENARNGRRDSDL